MGKFSTLEKAELTQNWSVEERAALAQFLEKQQLAKGEQLYYEQAKEKKLYFLDEGVLEIHGASIKVEFLPGQSLGELSLLKETAKQTSALAKENCIFWVLTEESWRELRRSSPAVALKLIESINSKLAHLLDQSLLPPKLSKIISKPGASEAKLL